MPSRRFERSQPRKLIALSFAALVLIGSLLLSLPMAAADGHSVSYLDALFTATSAICVTGLIVVDTPVAFSTFGHAIILLLIQIGGLGYMSISTILAAAIGRSISLQERLTLQEGTQRAKPRRRGALHADGTEADAGVRAGRCSFLAVRWWPEYGIGAIWLGVFHSVSAFNNAGFALWSDSLMRWRGDVTVNLVITALDHRRRTGVLRHRRAAGPAPAPVAAVACTRASCSWHQRSCRSAGRRRS